jgi:hypothetical protein
MYPTRAAMLLLSGLVAAGCQTTPSGEYYVLGDPRVQHAQRVRGFKCTPGNCKVEVEKNLDSLGRALCPVTLNPDVLDVRMGGGPRKAQKVVFSIDTDYPFKFVDPRVPGAKHPVRIKSGGDPFDAGSAPVVDPKGKKLELLLREMPSNNSLVEFGLLVARDQVALSYCAEIDPWMVD